MKLPRILMTVSLLLVASCGGEEINGHDSGSTPGDCELAGQKPPVGGTCCNGMTSDDLGQGICRQPVGGPCYSDDHPTALPSGKSCCNDSDSATYLGTVGSCDGGGSESCSGNASCRVGNICLGSGFCGGTCLTIGQGTASVQFPCCPGLTADDAGRCYPPAGHPCNENADCLSRVCKPSGVSAQCH